MDITTLKTIQSNFLKELQHANSGKKTSLPFIVHEMSPCSIVADGESFQSLVIGGTVAKTATLRKKDANIEILDSRQYQVSFKTEEGFLSFVESKIRKDINVLSLNFAYPIQPVFENGKLDGVLLAVTKEVEFHGLVGKKIGKEIEDYIFKKRKKEIIVSVANDTVCLLLSGLVKYNSNNIAAGIVGTGLNFAFFLDKYRLVNLESANFDKFPQSTEGKFIDKESSRPRKALFEKEIAGAYLYKHFNVIIKERKIDFSPINSTEELSTLCHPEFISGSKNKNRKKMLKLIRQAQSLSDNRRQVQHDMTEASEIAQSLLIRSAQLVACQIAGITEFKQKDMVFNMEGSLFWKANGYKETVTQTVKQLVPEYDVKFVEIKDSGILGAAKHVS